MLLHILSYLITFYAGWRLGRLFLLTRFFKTLSSILVELEKSEYEEKD